jgi:hypothetical protein
LDFRKHGFGVDEVPSSTPELPAPQQLYGYGSNRAERELAKFRFRIVPMNAVIVDQRISCARSEFASIGMPDAGIVN